MTWDPNQLLAVLDQWKQGDYTFDFADYFHFADLVAPNTELSRTAAADQAGGAILTAEGIGVMMISQTCDIIKPPEVEPYVEVCAIVRVDQVGMDDVKKWGKPLKACIPALEDQLLIADLSRVMTIEKGALLTWKRNDGFPQEKEQKNLARILERKVSRFAFPDNINPWVTKLKRKLRDKIDKNTPEGACIRGIHQLRLRGRPGWKSRPCVVDFLFLLESEVSDEQRKAMLPIIESFMGLVENNGEFVKGEIDLKHFDEISAAEYLNSEMLDVVLLS